MTIASTLNKNIYLGNGNTKIWPITFPFTDASQIKVYITDNYDLTTELTKDFIITDNQVIYPGYVDVAPVNAPDPLPNSWKITIYRSLPLTQEIALANQGPWDPDVMETGLDKIAMIQQQQQETLDRCVKLDISDTGKTEDYLKNINAAASSAAASSISASNSASIATVKADEAATSAANAAVSAASINPSNLVNIADVVTLAAPNKLLKLDGNGNLPTSAAGLGTKRVDESNIGTGKVLMYDSSVDKLEYNTLPVGSLGVTNYINSGGKITNVNGLTVSHGAIEASINYAVVKKDVGDIQTVQGKRQGLLTIDKNGNRGIQYAVDPVNFIDANTIGMWKPDGSASCPNLAVGKSKIAVANDLTRQGGMSSVDGLFGGDAAQGDGTTAYYLSANNTGFPTGASVREIVLCFTFYPTNSNAEMLAAYGASGGTQEFGLGKTDYGTLALTDYTNFNANDSKFTPEAGKTYLCSLAYDGTNATINVSGNQVQKMPYSLNTAAGVLRLAADLDASRKSKSVLHFVELRNAVRTPQQIAEMANKMCFPNSYNQTFPNEVIGGKTYYDVATIGNAISGGDYTGYPKSLAFDKNDTTSSYWGSAQTGGGVVGTAYIGQRVDYRIRKIRHLNYNNSSGNLSSVKIQWSYDGIAWTDIQTQSLSRVASVANEFDVADYPAVGTHYIRELANSAADSGASFDVAEIRMFTDDNPQLTKNITATLPTDTLSVGFFRSGASNLLAYNDADWQYGRRERAIGGNRKIRLTPKYFVGGQQLNWTNPFGTRRVRTTINWAQDANGTNESPTMGVWSNSAGTGFGVQYFSTAADFLRLFTCAGGVVYFNGAYQGTGYIIPYVEVLEED